MKLHGIKESLLSLFGLARRAGLWTAALLLAAPAGASAATLRDAGVTLKRSWKKPGENNPLYTQRFGADPGVMAYQDRIYVYMTDDVLEYDGAGRVKENSYSQIRCVSCISSGDLVNWTDHGKIPVAGPGGIAPWAANSWAPCAAHTAVGGRERFFLYFCNGGNGIGVLTADSPTGPWRDELGRLLITRATPNCADVLWLFDPAVMVDTDGTGYLAFGGGVPEGRQADPGTARIVRLGKDMMSLDGVPETVNAPWFFEDSGINRIGDRYVYSYCSNWQTKGNSLRLTDGAIQYMTADQPLGPYTYRGELFPNEGRFFGLYGNNHHSLVSLNGSWYLFYHSRPVEKAMGLSGNYRSPQADRVVPEEDGLLRRVTGTMRGLSQLKPLDPYSEVPGTAMADQAGIRVESEAGRCRSDGEAGSWIRVAGADFGSGTKSVSLRCASVPGCVLYLLTDDPGAPVAASVEIPAGTSRETELTVPLSADGIRDLYIVFGGEASLYSWTVR